MKQIDKTQSENALKLLCSDEGFLGKRVGNLGNSDFFIQDLVDFEWQPTPEFLRKRNVKPHQRIIFKTSMGCAKRALKMLEESGKWKNPIVSMNQVRREQEIEYVASNLVSLSKISDEDFEAHIRRKNVVVSWYDIITHLPCQIYNKSICDHKINYLDVRVVARLECHREKDNEYIYVYDMNNQRIEKIPNNLGWLKSFTRAMPLEEAQRLEVAYYDEYGKGQLGSYGRILVTMNRHVGEYGSYVESFEETFQKDPRKAVARVGKTIEVIEYHKEDDRENTKNTL